MCLPLNEHIVSRRELEGRLPASVGRKALTVAAVWSIWPSWSGRLPTPSLWSEAHRWTTTRTGSMNSVRMEQSSSSHGAVHQDDVVLTDVSGQTEAVELQDRTLKVINKWQILNFNIFIIIVFIVLSWGMLSHLYFCTNILVILLK